MSFRPGTPVRTRDLARVGPAIGLAALTGTLATLAACADHSAAGPTGPNAQGATQQGTLSVLLTDDPFPFDSVARADIYVVRIDARRAEPDSAATEHGKDDDHKPGENEHEGEHHGGSGASGGSHEGAAAAAADSTVWVTVSAPNARINLLDLQGGTTAALGQQALPVGTYRGFRVVVDVDSSSVTLKGGAVLTASSHPGIRFANKGRSGIKVMLDRPITVADTGAHVVFDFDLGRSFALRGGSPGSGGFEFRPVIRATVPGLTGSLTGTVRDQTSGNAVRGATVELLQANTAASDTTRERVVATAATGERGAYTAAFLTPGHYAVRVTARSGRSAHATVFVPDVEVRAGAEPARRDVTLP